MIESHASQLPHPVNWEVGRCGCRHLREGPATSVARSDRSSAGPRALGRARHRIRRPAVWRLAVLRGRPRRAPLGDEEDEFWSGSDECPENIDWASSVLTEEAHSAYAVLATRLSPTELPPPPEGRPVRPPCGHCDERTRRHEDVNGADAGRCRVCHPLVRAKDPTELRSPLSLSPNQGSLAASLRLTSSR